jgi:dTMP kinase
MTGGGRLVVFEGVEGAGKTTQLERLRTRLERAGVACEMYREPGGTDFGAWIRDGVLDRDWHIVPRAEAHVFMASRAQLVDTKIRPALAAGRLVLLDRFFLSTYAYQVGGRGLDEAQVRAANLLATDGLVPDLTILLELPARLGLSRAEYRGPKDRIERAGPEFLQNVADAFALFARPAWQAAHPEAGPIVTVNAVGSPLEVEERVVRVFADRLPDVAAALELVA